jgi:hypothetical protein
VTITDPSELAGAMTDQLVELFDENVDARAPTRVAQPTTQARRRFH